MGRRASLDVGHDLFSDRLCGPSAHRSCASGNGRDSVLAGCATGSDMGITHCTRCPEFPLNSLGKQGGAGYAVGVRRKLSGRFMQLAQRLGRGL